MKRLHFSSFRQRLNAAFLAVSLVPMLLCSGLLRRFCRLLHDVERPADGPTAAVRLLRGA